MWCEWESRASPFELCATFRPKTCNKKAMNYRAAGEEKTLNDNKPQGKLDEQSSLFFLSWMLTFEKRKFASALEKYRLWKFSPQNILFSLARALQSIGGRNLVVCLGLVKNSLLLFVCASKKQRRKYRKYRSLLQ